MSVPNAMESIRGREKTSLAVQFGRLLLQNLDQIVSIIISVFRWFPGLYR